MTLTLLCTPRSPFARRVRLALRRLGLEHREEWVDPFAPAAEFLQANPLGLVPVAIGLADEPLPDSALILEELHSLTGAIWPANPRERSEFRRLSALAEGIMAAAVAYYLEGIKPQPDVETRQEQIEIIVRTLAMLDQRSVPLESQPGWDLAVALEYLGLRCPQLEWRAPYPGLAGHLERALLDPHFIATRPPAA